MLETQALSKAFGSTLALDRVSLRVEPGEIYCLLGANGAGKTTLINVFLNFHEPLGRQGAGRRSGRDDPRAPATLAPSCGRRGC